MLNTLEQVEQWVQARGLSADGSVVTLNEEFEYLVWVRLLIAQNQPTQALRLLERLQDAAEQRGRTGRVIEMLVLQALAQQALGDTEQALATIERALSPAEPEGYIRLFVDEGRPMAMLLCQAVSRDITPDYVSKLLTVWGAEEQERPLSPPSPVTRAKPPVKTAPQLIEPLSKRELEVLRLMSAGLTNQQIAETLVVALGTAKAHTASIYAKLDVHNRTQAVARARELDLL